MSEAPKFFQLNDIEETLLLAKLEAVRAVIAHAGEKGRALENVVRIVLRSIRHSHGGTGCGSAHCTNLA
jgi:hypothetical protein